MATMNIIPEGDQVMLGLCFHGQAKQIDESNYRPEWLESDIGRRLVSACISLDRDGQPVNAISAITRAQLHVDGLMSEVITIYKNGFGRASLKDAIEASYQNYLARQAQEIAAEMQRLAQKDPRNVRELLIAQASRIGSLVRDGEVYDPRPSVLAEGQLPTLFAPTLIENMGDTMRQGYYHAWLTIYAGITKHGKSTTLYSHALDLVLQMKRVVLITTETDPAIVSAQLAASLSGIDFMKEVVTKQFIATERESPEERQKRYRSALEYLNAYLRVYPTSYCNDEALKRIVKWPPRPDAVILDYLKKAPNLLTRHSYSQDEVGDFADWLLTFSHGEGLCFLTAGQISNEMSSKLVRKDTGELVILYGSARVGMAADLFVFLKRHPSRKDPPYAYFRVQLDRYFGRLDTTHQDTSIDPKRRILRIPRLTAMDTIGFDF